MPFGTSVGPCPWMASPTRSHPKEAKFVESCIGNAVVLTQPSSIAGLHSARGIEALYLCVRSWKGREGKGKYCRSRARNNVIPRVHRGLE